MTWSCCPHMTSSVSQGYETAGPLLYGALKTFLAAQCLLTPNLVKETTEHRLQEVSNITYDFIIVGGGTAGAVLANRLTENPEWKVLLLEAGGNPTLGTEIPSHFINNFGTETDWNFPIEPQKNACLTHIDNKCYWVSGKVLGGSSSINGMYYIRGNKADYDGWGRINEEWSYDNVLPYFKKSENLSTTNADDIDIRYHSNEGLLTVEDTKNVHPIEKIIIDANVEIGVPINEDFNGESQIGIGRSFTTTKQGTRQSSVNAYLKLALDRDNLHVLRNVVVDKIVFDNMTATGINLATQYGDFQIFANKEIILSAGTVNSAVILLKSGVGPKELLDNSNITVKTNLPVGKNVKDHVYAPVTFKMKSSDDINTLPNLFKNYYQFITEKNGPLSDLSPQKAMSFINTTDINSKLPNIQNLFTISYPNQSNLINLPVKYKLNEKYNEEYHKLIKDHLLITAYVILLQPNSKGSIEIDDMKAPVIEANYFDDDKDIQTIVQGMNEIIKLEDTKAFKEAGLKLHWFDIGCNDSNFVDYLKCVAKHLTGSLYHATGSCAMGDEGVVTPSLKVKNIEKLRVVDASVMPEITRGNTMAPVVMIAEKASDYIKRDWEIVGTDELC